MSSFPAKLGAGGGGEGEDIWSRHGGLESGWMWAQEAMSPLPGQPWGGGTKKEESVSGLPCQTFGLHLKTQQNSEGPEGGTG